MTEVNRLDIVRVFVEQGPMTEEEVAHTLGQLPTSIEGAFQEAARDGLIQKVQSDAIAETLTWQVSAEGTESVEASD
jgi:Mn-dependent DtxR family transcriptional regulator